MSARNRKFTQSEEVSLALAVEKYPTLWDCTLESYRRADLKPQLWCKVAAEVGASFTGEFYIYYCAWQLTACTIYFETIFLLVRGTESFKLDLAFFQSSALKRPRFRLCCFQHC